MKANSLRKNIHYAFILILLIWSIIATYCSINNINIITLFVSPSQPTHLEKRIDQEFHFLLSFLTKYYKIEKNTDKNPEVVEQLFSANNKDRILKEYAQTLSYFKLNKGRQEFSPLKVIYHSNEELYIAYLLIHQILKEKQTYLVKVTFKITPTIPTALSIEDNSYLISFWEEQILKDSPPSLEEKTIKMGPNHVSHLRLPCATTIVAPISKKTGIGVSLGPDSKNMRFNSDHNFLSQTQFKAQCGKYIFWLHIKYDANILTVYQSLSLSDAESLKPQTKPKKILSPREKLEQDIEAQLGIKIKK